MPNVTASAPATARCRCCRASVPADQIQQDGTCTGCSAPRPRFEAGSFLGTLTVRDREADAVVVHQATWDEDMAAMVAARLNDQPRYTVVYSWETLA
jgi:hypothetical protein